MRRGGVTRGWAGQGDGEPCREVGVEGAIDRVKRLAPRLFSRLGVAGVDSRDVGSTFPFLVSACACVCVCSTEWSLCRTHNFEPRLYAMMQVWV